MRKIILFMITLSMGIFTFGYAAPININTADATTIAANLSNIGPAKADAIIDYREKNGPFESINDLLKVKGIGEKTIEQNRENILIDPVEIAPEANTTSDTTSSVDNNAVNADETPQA